MNASASGIAEFDKMLAIKLLPAGAAGVYAAASRVIGALVLPVIAMMVSAMPRLFRETSHEGHKLYSSLFICAAVYGVAAALGIWLLAPWLQPVFGAEYAGMDEIIRWLALAVPAVSLRATAANILTTIERPWSRVGVEVSGWFVMALLAWFATSTMGEFGLALSVVCVEWLLACSLWTVILMSRNRPEN